MSCIEIIRDHNLPQSQVMRLADQVMVDIAQEYSLSLQWQGNKLLIQHPHTKGYLYADSENIRIKLKLGFFLIPMSVSLKKTIEEALDEILPSTVCITTPM